MQKVGKTSEILRIALPSAMGGIVSVLAGMIDSFMVSSLGSGAVAAIGLIGMPQWFCFSIFLAVNNAVTVLIARRYGEKNRDAACGVSLTTTLLIALLSIVMGILLAVYASPIMKLCGSNPEIHDYATDYFRIIMGFVFFQCLGMQADAILCGTGETKVTMVSGITANVINIIFNYLLIGGNLGFPAMGVKGAAIATIVGIAVSVSIKIHALCDRNSFVSIRYIIDRKIKPSYIYIKETIGVGYSIFVEQILLRSGNLVAGIMIAMQGTAALAAHNIWTTTTCFSSVFANGVRTAAVALVGKSLGENDKEKAKLYGGRSMNVIFTMTLICSCIFLLFGKGIMKIYFREEKEVIDIGVNLMYFVIPAAFFSNIQLVMMGCLHGAGDIKVTAVIASTATILMWVGMGYIFAFTLGLGIYGMWIGFFLDNFLMFILSWLRYKSGRWETIKI